MSFKISKLVNKTANLNFQRVNKEYLDEEYLKKENIKKKESITEKKNQFFFQQFRRKDVKKELLKANNTFSCGFQATNDTKNQTGYQKSFQHPFLDGIANKTTQDGSNKKSYFNDIKQNFKESFKESFFGGFPTRKISISRRLSESVVHETKMIYKKRTSGSEQANEDIDERYSNLNNTHYYDNNLLKSQMSGFDQTLLKINTQKSSIANEIVRSSGVRIRSKSESKNRPMKNVRNVKSRLDGRYDSRYVSFTKHMDQVKLNCIEKEDKHILQQFQEGFAKSVAFVSEPVLKNKRTEGDAQRAQRIFQNSDFKMELTKDYKNLKITGFRTINQVYETSETKLSFFFNQFVDLYRDYGQNSKKDGANFDVFIKNNIESSMGLTFLLDDGKIIDSSKVEARIKEFAKIPFTQWNKETDVISQQNIDKDKHLLFALEVESSPHYKSCNLVTYVGILAHMYIFMRDLKWNLCEYYRKQHEEILSKLDNKFSSGKTQINHMVNQYGKQYFDGKKKKHEIASEISSLAVMRNGMNLDFIPGQNDRLTSKVKDFEKMFGNLEFISEHNRKINSCLATMIGKSGKEAHSQ